MTFTPKVWHDGPDGGTPLSGAAITDMETRLSAPFATFVPQGGLFVNPKDKVYGAVGDAQENGDGAITSGSNVLTSAASAGAWTADPSLVGKKVLVIGAGASNGPLWSTITAYDSVGSSTQVTLADNAGTTVAGAMTAWGTDDTAALDAAFTVAAGSRSGSVYMPPGGYMYNGNGYSSAYPRMHAIGGQGGVAFYLGVGKSLIVSPNAATTPSSIKGIDVSNIRTVGGFGMVRLTYTGAQSLATQKRVIGVRPEYFTGAGVSSLASDDPFWNIDIMPVSRAIDRVIGVAIAGETDDCRINIDNYYGLIGVKLGNGGVNARITGSNVLNVYQGTPRIPIWIVPLSVLNNAGPGLVIDKFKFGNENANAADYRVVYADEDAATGSDFATRLPALTVASTGFITGHFMHSCLVSGSATTPIVFSTTPKVYGCSYKVVLTGTAPSYFLQYLTAPGPDREGQSNTFEAMTADGASGIDGPTFPISNGHAGYVNDPTGIMGARLSHRPGAGDLAAYAALLSTAIRSFTTASATLANVSDALGGADATEATFSASSGIVYHSITAPTVGQPVWIEFDVKQGSSSPQANLQMQMQYTASGAIHFRRNLTPSSAWQRVRFLWTPREASASILLIFGVPTGVTAGLVQLGRVRVYHAQEPVNVDGNFPKIAVQGAATVGGSLAVAGGLTVGGVTVGGDPNPFGRATGEATLDRRYVASNGLTLTSGTVRLAYMCAYKTETVNNLIAFGGGTAAGATPTHVLFGVYSVAGNGDLTLLASTTDDTAVFAAANGAYTKALSAAVSKAAGSYYAIGTLVVTAAALPTLAGASTFGGISVSEASQAPRICGACGPGLSALPATIPNGSITSLTGLAYAVLTP